MRMRKDELAVLVGDILARSCSRSGRAAVRGVAKNRYVSMKYNDENLCG